MKIKDDKFEIIVFSNQYGYYTCIKTPIDKEKSDYYKKYINIRFMPSARGKIKVSNGDILQICDGWFSVWDGQLYLNINEFKVLGKIEKSGINGNETRKR